MPRIFARSGGEAKGRAGVDSPARIEQQGSVARLRDLEPGEAGLLTRVVHAVMRRALGRELNPHKVIARSPRALLFSVVGNIILGTGRWEIGRDLAQLVRTRAAARNGCPF